MDENMNENMNENVNYQSQNDQSQNTQNTYTGTVDGYNTVPVKTPGDSEATTSMVLGIVSLATYFLGLGIVTPITAIIGLVYASKAKNLGYTGGKRTAGYTCSLIGIILFGLALIAVIAMCALGIAAGAGSLGFLYNMLDSGMFY